MGSYQANLQILRFRKLLAAVMSPRRRRALRFGVAASIEHKLALGAENYNTIVDIGANKGQFALFARHQFPSARIISFEPLAAAAAIYDAIFQHDPLVRLHNVGIGAADGLVDLHVTRANDASSILTPSETGKATFGISVVDIARVQIAPLPNFISPAEIVAPALLKLDVQGYELDALKGCDDLLEAFGDIYVEVSFVEIYETQPLAKDVIDWLHARGFSLRGVFNQIADSSRGPLQADLLFRREREWRSSELARPHAAQMQSESIGGTARS